MQDAGLYIDGQWREPLVRRERLPVFDPATGDVLATIADADDDDCDAALDAASRAQEAWAATSPRERGEMLRRAWALMLDRSEELARTIVRENGKTIRDARGEVAYAAEFFRWFAEEAVRVPGDMRRSPNGDNWIMVTHEPVGVALLVTPWNYPAAMAARKIAPALAAGCTAVLKPAKETPLTALALVALLEEAGLPPGVLNVVTTSRSGARVGRMLQDRRVRALSFTGSTEVGQVLLAAAAANVVRCSMELGGNAPFVVLEDADLESAVEGLMVAKLRNGGSACTAANRVYVAAAVAEEFTARFSSRMSQVRNGNGLDEDVDLGPLINASTRDKVASLVEEAVAAGATLITGGSPEKAGGLHYPATVLTGVRPDAAILRTEIFGPVAPVVTFDSAEQAVALANDSDCGLVAYVYTRDLSLGLSMSRRLKAGMIGLNKGVVSDPAAPFGGVKHSGLGREGASEGILEYLDTKYTAIPYG
jgi:succinate-semialdehyde dehydrogenase/glutarate-semialdehyde dehydrogenase